MDVRKEIINYIVCEEASGALLLTGQWGCGKSYLMKEIINDLNKENIAAIGTVSLFGLNNISDVRTSVKEEYTHFLLGNSVNKIFKIKNKTANVVNDAMQVAKAATPGNVTVSAVSKGVSSLLSFDIFSFFEVKNTITIKEKTKKTEKGVNKSKSKEIPFVLVFDDFERCSISVKNIFGVINEYLENKQIKVIVIADEEKIIKSRYKSEHYNEFKEKLISRTIKLKDDENRIATSIIDNFNTKNKKYKDFLEDNKETVLSVYEQSNYNNLRTLKVCLCDFERIYTSWNESEFEINDLPWELYVFCAKLFEYKAGNFGKIVDFELYGIIPKNSDEKSKIESKYAENTFMSGFTSVSKWICEGDWNKEDFVEELKRKYCKTELSCEDKFLKHIFWDLNQEIINDALPKIIEKAYKGECSCDDLITLFQKVHLMKKYSITLPCEIDYSKINAGYDKRLEQIKAGTLLDMQRFTDTQLNEIDDEAVVIYKKIKKTQIMIAAWKNRRLFIDFINCRNVNRYDLHNKILIEFDDALYDVFKSKFFNSDNINRKELFLALDGLEFGSNNYSDSANKQTTIKNFNNFIDDLNNDIRTNKDGISVALSKMFIEKITAKIKYLKNC